MHLLRYFTLLLGETLKRGKGHFRGRPDLRRRRFESAAMRETAFVRKQYHFWPAERGLDAWDVDRLIEVSRGLPVELVPIDSISEIDTQCWFDRGAEIATVRKVAERARLIAEVDTSYPIILGHDGLVMDGMHRIARALLEGRDEIEVVRFPAPVEPDHRGCLPHELPY